MVKVGYQDKRFSNWKQTSFEQFPSKWFACGLCSIGALLTLLGYQLKPRDLLNLVVKDHDLVEVRSVGLGTHQMKKLLEHYGLLVKEVQRNTEFISFKKNLIKILSKGLPVLINYETHVVLVYSCVPGTF